MATTYHEGLRDISKDGPYTGGGINHVDSALLREFLPPIVVRHWFFLSVHHPEICCRSLDARYSNDGVVWAVRYSNEEDTPEAFVRGAGEAMAEVFAPLRQCTNVEHMHAILLLGFDSYRQDWI